MAWVSIWTLIRTPAWIWRWRCRARWLHGRQSGCWVTPRETSIWTGSFRTAKFSKPGDTRASHWCWDNFRIHSEATVHRTRSLSNEICRLTNKESMRTGCRRRHNRSLAWAVEAGVGAVDETVGRLRIVDNIHRPQWHIYSRAGILGESVAWRGRHGMHSIVFHLQSRMKPKKLAWFWFCSKTVENE